ncbi:hypothetical protein JRQ81_016505 [Phrynocephalus forsythii]|uniref:Tyr recombinase domain-containing protein n=1 Tax=Phrynocephalus forsythii TaxID=171643 RepID=A0A9Q0XSE3_9SAUR|nr:hypothetical protein JRQ81_016505 [Phrynocephalus forsythii]
MVLPNFFPNPTTRIERDMHTLDVRRTLAFYVSRTKSIRKTNELFVCHDPVVLGHPVSPQRFARWIVQSIKLSYELAKVPLPLGIRAHSTRAMASSAAFLKGVPLDDICQAATWSTPDTFVTHYRVDAHVRSATSFGRAVLSFVTA